MLCVDAQTAQGADFYTIDAARLLKASDVRCHSLTSTYMMLFLGLRLRPATWSGAVPGAGVNRVKHAWPR
jgi:hypothetical protein